MPVPGTTTPEPSPLVQVVLHAIPAASITEMWVVEPRRLDRKPCRNASAERPSRNSAVRSDWAAAIASTMTGSDGGGRPPAGRRGGAGRGRARAAPRGGGWRHPAAVEGPRAAGGEPPGSGAELGVAHRLPPLKDAPVGGPQRCALGGRDEQVGEDLRDVGLRRVQRDALAGQACGGCGEVCERD